MKLKVQMIGWKKKLCMRTLKVELENGDSSHSSHSREQTCKVQSTLINCMGKSKYWVLLQWFNLSRRFVVLYALYFNLFTSEASIRIKQLPIGVSAHAYKVHIQIQYRIPNATLYSRAYIPIYPSIST